MLSAYREERGSEIGLDGIPDVRFQGSLMWIHWRIDGVLEWAKRRGV